MIEITSKGDFSKTEAFLKRAATNKDIGIILHHYGQQGVNALAAATPVRTGQTAASWYYEVIQKAGSASIIWHNSNVAAGQPIVLLLQYGHGTGTGGYVQGRDFIMPAVIPIFDQITEEAWKAVIS